MGALNHTADELKVIAKLLDAMNEFERESSMLSLQGGPEIWWCDMRMGLIGRGDEAEEKEGEWCYVPCDAVMKEGSNE